MINLRQSFLKRGSKNRRSGFSLVEIMFVIGITAILAAIAFPAYQRSRKRAQATVILQELRVLDNALEQYASESFKPSGSTVEFEDLKPYLQQNSVLYKTGADFAGHPYGPFAVDTRPKVHAATYDAYLEVADETFWAPYH